MPRDALIPIGLMALPDVMPAIAESLALTKRAIDRDIVAPGNGVDEKSDTL